MDGIDYTYISPDSGYYSEVVDLRYRVFYKPTGSSLENVFDGLEDKSVHLVAARGGRLIGYARLTVDELVGHVSQIVVKEPSRRTGIGTELLRRLVKKAAELGARDVFLDARVHAMGFYERLGFQRVGEDFPSPKTGLPHWRMQRPVEPTSAPGDARPNGT